MLIKHLIFVAIAFCVCFALKQFVLDAETGQFVIVSGIFWSLISSAILYFSLTFGKNATSASSTNILLGGLVAKFTAATFFFLVYMLYTKHATMWVGISFVIQSFLFTSWVLYAVDTIIEWIEKYQFQLTIAKARSSKLGDFRPPNPKKPYYRISVNHNLNPYEFLITLVHEIAHLVTYDAFGRKVEPHGTEWKNNYIQLLHKTVELNCYPIALMPAIQFHMQHPGASSCADTQLARELRKYNTNVIPFQLLEELPTGTQFVIQTDRRKRLFKKGERLRKRFRCVEVATSRTFLVSPVAEVIEVK